MNRLWPPQRRSRDAYHSLTGSRNSASNPIGDKAIFSVDMVVHQNQRRGGRPRLFPKSRAHIKVPDPMLTVSKSLRPGAVMGCW